MQGTRVDVASGTVLDVVGAMTVTGEQVIGLDSRKATKLLLRVSMRDGDPASVQGDQAPAFQTDSSDLSHRHS